MISFEWCVVTISVFLAMHFMQPLYSNAIDFTEKVVVDSVDSRDANDTIQIRGESNSKDLFVVSSFLTNGLYFVLVE